MWLQLWDFHLVARHKRYAKSALLTMWQEKFGKDRHDLTPVEVAQLVISNVDGGSWLSTFYGAGF